MLLKFDNQLASLPTRFTIVSRLVLLWLLISFLGLSGCSLSPWLSGGGSEDDVDPYLTGQFDAALEAMAQQQWQQAEQLLLAITQVRPDLSGPWVNLGVVYQQQESHHQALQAWQQAATVNPNNADAYNYLGVYYRQQGDFKQAREYYAQGLVVAPENQFLLLNMAILLDLYLADWPQALHYYQRYQQLVGEEDQQVTGWIIDLQRRISQGQ